MRPPEDEEPMRVSTKRRKRRRAKAKLKNKAAVRKHMEVAGRTGGGNLKRRTPGKTPAHSFRVTMTLEVKPPPWWRVG
jgi:hypothetical protein